MGSAWKAGALDDKYMCLDELDCTQSHLKPQASLKDEQANRFLS